MFRRLNTLILSTLTLTGLVEISRADEATETKRQGPKGTVSSCIVCNDWAATKVGASSDVMIWRLPDGKENHLLKGDSKAKVNCFCFSPSGEELCVSYYGRIRFWNLNKPGQFTEKEWKSCVVSDYSPDGKSVIRCTMSKLEVFNRRNLDNPIATYDPKVDVMTGIARFSSDGKYVIAAIAPWLKGSGAEAKDEYELRRISFENKDEIRSESFPSRWRIWALEAISADRYLVASSGVCHIWDSSRNKLQKLSPEPKGMSPLSMDSQSKFVSFATGSQGDQIVVLDGKTLKQRVFKMEGPVWSVGVSSKHGVLVVGYGNPFAPGEHNDGYVGFRKEPSLKEAK